LLAVVSSQEDFHLQDHAHAGRTKRPCGRDRRAYHLLTNAMLIFMVCCMCMKFRRWFS